MLKPDIVYFGENVPQASAWTAAFAMVDDADALLVAGSSLTVMSGLRFVRHAANAASPWSIVNRGTTRGDESRHPQDSTPVCSEALAALLDASLRTARVTV